MTEQTGRLYFVFDCESVGLHGQTFAVGVVVVDEQGNEIVATRLAAPAVRAFGNADGRKWLDEHLPDFGYDYGFPREVRASFWALWREFAKQGALMVTDCGWPVEANFLTECVHDEPTLREWEGPYPLFDVSTLLLAAGKDPTASYPRSAQELPEHDPLADARQSARIWLGTLRALGGRGRDD